MKKYGVRGGTKVWETVLWTVIAGLWSIEIGLGFYDRYHRWKHKKVCPVCGTGVK